MFLSFDTKLFGSFLCVSLSLSFVLWHLFLLPLLILLLLTFGSMMIKPVRTFRRTSHDEAFIRNAKSFYKIFSILALPLLSTVGVGSHYVAS